MSRSLWLARRRTCRPPRVEEAGAKFARLRTPAKRLELLIRDSVHCYSEGEGWLHAARRERDLIPAVGEAVRVQEETLQTLVRAATHGLDLSKRDIGVLYAFCDFPFFKSLVDAGVKRSGVADVIVDVALTY